MQENAWLPPSRPRFLVSGEALSAPYGERLMAVRGTH